MPRAIENYVQEIGRAGRDGKLARCHMFLSNDDFYQLRRISLSDLLDHQCGLRLTSRIISQAKRVFANKIFPEQQQNLKKSKKRKSMQNSEDGFAGEECFETLIDVFENEQLLTPYYNKEQKCIRMDEVPELSGKPLFIALECKETLAKLDLRKEVVMTMLSQLE